MEKKLWRRGCIITVGYLAVIVAWVFLGTDTTGRSRWGEFTTMPLNNIGDFLAGVFSPLAFLWLVLGFLQQGEELRIQAEELRNSVHQQRDLVQVARDEHAATLAQLQFERQRIEREREEQLQAVSPDLRPHGLGGSHKPTGSRHSIHFTNFGARAFDVSLTSDSARVEPESHPSIEPGKSVMFVWELPPVPQSLEASFVLRWKNSLGHTGERIYRALYERAADGGNYQLRMEAIAAKMGSS